MATMLSSCLLQKCATLLPLFVLFFIRMVFHIRWFRCALSDRGFLTGWLRSRVPKERTLPGKIVALVLEWDSMRLTIRYFAMYFLVIALSNAELRAASMLGWIFFPLATAASFGGFATECGFTL